MNQKNILILIILMQKLTVTTTSSITGGEGHGHKQECRTVNTSATEQCTRGNAAQHEGVTVKSTVSSDSSSTVSISNQQRLDEIISKLGSTHSQIDEYARRQTDKINAETQREIDEVVVRTRLQQEELLRKANEHTTQIDAEHRERLQRMVEEADAAKAKRIADIEQELNNQQTGILQAARAEIDRLNQKAASLKIEALQQAQTKAAVDANQITAELSHLGQGTTLHQSTGTTTIKTEVSAAATTEEVGGTTATTSFQGAGGARETIETTKRQSHNSRK